MNIQLEVNNKDLMRKIEQHMQASDLQRISEMNEEYLEQPSNELNN